MKSPFTLWMSNWSIKPRHIMKHNFYWFQINIFWRYGPDEDEKILKLGNKDGIRTKWGRGPNKDEKGRGSFKRPRKLQFENPPNLFGSRRVAMIFSTQTAFNISPSRKSFILLSILKCKYFKNFTLSIWISWSQSYSGRDFSSISCFESLSTVCRWFFCDKTKVIWTKYAKCNLIQFKCNAARDFSW